MEDAAFDRSLAVVADGSTDRELVSAFVHAAMAEGSGEAATSPFRYVELLARQNIRTFVDEFSEEADKTGNYGVVSRHANGFIGRVVGVIHAGVAEWADRMRERPLSCRDLLVLNTDAEKHLAGPEQYFEVEWATAYYLTRPPSSRACRSRLSLDRCLRAFCSRPGMP